jgi:hypothetical protein
MKKIALFLMTVVILFLMSGSSSNTSPVVQDDIPSPPYTIEKVVYEIRVCEYQVSAARFYYKNPDGSYTWDFIPEGPLVWVKIFEEWPDRFIIPHLCLFATAPKYALREGFIAWKRSDLDYFELVHQKCAIAYWNLWAQWPL